MFWGLLQKILRGGIIGGRGYFCLCAQGFSLEDLEKKCTIEIKQGLVKSPPIAPRK